MRLTSVISEPIPQNLGTIWYFARRQLDLLALVLALTKEPASRGYWILWHHLSLCSALLVRATNEMKSTDVFLQVFDNELRSDVVIAQLDVQAPAVRQDTHWWLTDVPRAIL